MLRAYILLSWLYTLIHITMYSYICLESFYTQLVYKLLYLCLIYIYSSTAQRFIIARFLCRSFCLPLSLYKVASQLHSLLIRQSVLFWQPFGSYHFIIKHGYFFFSCSSSVLNLRLNAASSAFILFLYAQLLCATTAIKEN